MSAADARAIADAARVVSQDVTFLEAEDTDHFLMVHPSIEHSFRDDSGSYAVELEQRVVDWLLEKLHGDR